MPLGRQLFLPSSNFDADPLKSTLAHVEAEFGFLVGAASLVAAAATVLVIYWSRSPETAEFGHIDVLEKDLGLVVRNSSDVGIFQDGTVIL